MKKLLFLATCFGLLLMACGDETSDNEQNPDPEQPEVPEDPQEPEEPEEPEDVYTADKFMSELRGGILQTFDANTADLPREFVLDGGIKITIPEDALTKNGQPITGDFTVEILEVMSPSAAIFSGTNTNYRGGLYDNARYLISDGFFNIDVKQDGVSVDQALADGKYLGIYVPGPADENRYETRIWMGTEVSATGQAQFGWEDPEEEDIDAQNSDRAENRIWKNGDGFEFGFGKLGWCNCDIFWGEGPYTTVTVELTGNVGELATFMGGSGDTFVFFKPKGHLSVCQLYTVVGENTVASYENSMPVDHEGIMIAFSIVDGEFSLAVEEITITADMRLTLDLKKVTKEYLVEIIKGLDIK